MTRGAGRRGARGRSVWVSATMALASMAAAAGLAACAGRNETLSKPTAPGAVTTVPPPVSQGVPAVPGGSAASGMSGMPGMPNAQGQAGRQSGGHGMPGMAPSQGQSGAHDMSGMPGMSGAQANAQGMSNMPGMPAKPGAAGTNAMPGMAGMAAHAEKEPTPEMRKAGAKLAAGGAPGVAPCASCHGRAGEGNAASGMPRLAGQSYDYLEEQLEHFAEGMRRDNVMSPIAAALSPEQRGALAAYYASLAPGGSSARSGSRARQAPVDARGRQLATVGDESIGVQACANCHGPEGAGGSAAPYLAGQHERALEHFLAAWRDGSRMHDETGQMPRIAKSLGAADVKALARYFAALPPPRRAMDADVPERRTVAAAKTIVSGPRPAAPAQPARGRGSEQGVPATGSATGTVSGAPQPPGR